jgi:N-acetylneuraminic acid mutarotase
VVGVGVGVLVGDAVLVGVGNGKQVFHKFELFSHNEVVSFHTQFAGVLVGVGVKVVVGVMVCVTLGVGVNVDVTVGVIDLVGVGSGDALCV